MSTTPIPAMDHSDRFLAPDEIGRRIAALRKDRGVSQERLAKALGLDQSALSRIERGERGLAVAELVGIADYLGVETDALLRREVEAVPLFSNEGGAHEAEAALASFRAIIEDVFALEAATRV